MLALLWTGTGSEGLELLIVRALIAEAGKHYQRRMEQSIQDHTHFVPLEALARQSHYCSTAKSYVLAHHRCVHETNDVLSCDPHIPTRSQ